MVLLIGLIGAIIIGALCLLANFKRPLLSQEVDLIPNQLLTTHPVIFLSGKKSLFYFMNYWNKLPDRLRDHGHEVIEWPLPWRSDSQMKKHLFKRLEEARLENKVFHIIGDATLSPALYYMADLGHPSIQSLNLISGDINQIDTPHMLRPFRTPVRTYELSQTLRSQSGWTQYFIRGHRALTRRSGFEPQLLGATKDQFQLESFYLHLLSDLAVLDLRS